ncbi:MAG: YdeI/OmpD-associated family protein [Nocardioides sp.]
MGGVDWAEFYAAIEPLEWGDSTYTIIRVPAEVVEHLSAGQVRRVEGVIEGVEVNLALTKAPVVDGLFLWAGKSLMRRLGVKPGEPLQVRLRPVETDRVDIPDELATRLDELGITEMWQQLSPGRRRSLIYPIEQARTPSSRSKRIEALVEQIRGS